jgi:ribosomal protein S18 acetylase RimI-like enzyme
VAEQELSLEIRLIKPGDRLTGLSLGDGFTALKTFLQRHAKAYHEKSLARTYGVFDRGKQNKVVAYITLVCGEIVVGESDNDILQDSEIYYKYPHYPAIKIARLAVDMKYRGNEIGTTLVNLALGTAKYVICPAVGCRFVVVDSKKSAVKFYQKAGFTILDTEVNRARDEQVLFIDLQKTPAT